ncbi:MAG: NifB/NifX family molybdenum-iron cluster-binding protein [Candidatus Hydrogenedentes bacterium]|nr:NifB/NifX family molybdenum-iron cluster-binding protein [Candidatus Hydrogenedentota bacterium]
MKVAVSAEGPSLDAEVCPRFGRCPYFVIVDTKNFAFESLENVAASLGSGAGTQAARLLFDKDIKRVLTGDCGPNATEALTAAGIEIALGHGGTVHDAVQRTIAEMTGEDASTRRTDAGIQGVAEVPSDASSPMSHPGDSPFARGGGRMRQRAGRGCGQGHGRGRGMGRGQGRA